MGNSSVESFLLAQTFGLYMTIQAIILLSRASYYRELIAKMKEPGFASLVGCSITLMLGIFLVLIHNVWVMHPRVMVTVVCWIILIKSILWLAAPERMLNIAKRACAGKGYHIAVVLMGCFGLSLISKGFYVYIVNAGVIHGN